MTIKNMFLKNFPKQIKYLIMEYLSLPDIIAVTLINKEMFDLREDVKFWQYKFGSDFVRFKPENYNIFRWVYTIERDKINLTKIGNAHVLYDVKENWDDDKSYIYQMLQSPSKSPVKSIDIYNSKIWVVDICGNLLCFNTSKLIETSDKRSTFHKNVAAVVVTTNIFAILFCAGRSMINDKSISNVKIIGHLGRNGLYYITSTDELYINNGNDMIMIDCNVLCVAENFCKCIYLKKNCDLVQYIGGEHKTICKLNNVTKIGLWWDNSTEYLITLKDNGDLVKYNYSEINNSSGHKIHANVKDITCSDDGLTLYLIEKSNKLLLCGDNGNGNLFRNCPPHVSNPHPVGSNVGDVIHRDRTVCIIQKDDKYPMVNEPFELLDPLKNWGDYQNHFCIDVMPNPTFLKNNFRLT